MSDLPVLPDIPELVPLDVSIVTTGTLDGTGTFDKLMQISRVHLLEEYTKGRITSNDYAQVYLGAMNNIVDQSISFSLAKDKVSAEFQGIQLQNQITALNREKLIAEIALIQSNIALNEQQISMSKSQQLNTEAEFHNIAKTGERLDSDTEVNRQQLLLLIEQTDNLKNDNGFKA